MSSRIFLWKFQIFQQNIQAVANFPQKKMSQIGNKKENWKKIDR